MEIVKEVQKIIDIHKNDKIVDYTINSLNNTVKISTLLKLCTYPSNGNTCNHKNFKMEYYYDLFLFIVNNIISIYKDELLSNSDKNMLDSLVCNTLLIKLSRLIKGHILLEKLRYYIKSFCDCNFTKEYLLESAKAGTFLNFNFWLSLTKENDIILLHPSLQEELFMVSIGNSDDRLYKYIINKILSTNKLFLQTKPNIIIKMIDILGQSIIPPKYILRRLKLLSSHISLIPYFNNMLTAFDHEKILVEIHKYYYYIPYTFKTLKQLVEKFEYLYLSKINQICMISIIKGILKTDEEKNTLDIVFSLDKNIVMPNKLSDKAISIILNNNNDIIRSIKWYIIPSILFNNELNRRILQIMTSQNMITKYMVNNDILITSNNIKMILFTKFYPAKSIKEISINFMLHKLRILAKLKKKNKIINHTVKMYNVLNEIKTFEPITNINVLKEGSQLFQLNKMKFSTVPPRHLLPQEISIYKNFMLREKADGILIYNLPIDIYPHQEHFNLYRVKAEYIEELDLYLIFDIDIPNTTIIERYNLLRSLHNYTKNNMFKTITNFTDFIDIMLEEQTNIKLFLKNESKHQIKWYPKFACSVNCIDTNLYRELIDNVILEKYKFPTNVYCCDGIIISPLNGDREIKIKPLSHMTIDITYKNNNFYDRNNNIVNNIQNRNKILLKNNCIYRCNPIHTNPNEDIIFEVSMYRYDKKNPNPAHVIDNIINILRYNWKNEILCLDTIYYGKQKNMILNKKLSNMIHHNTTILEKQLILLSPNINRNWLDLGCGSGKLVKLIKRYDPKYYVGLDSDINKLVSALKYHDMVQDNYIFNSCDLMKNWNAHTNLWYSMDKILDKKFDYIVANFSLMHFCCDMFWEQLNNIVHENTLFLFNLVRTNNNNFEWSESKSFLKVNNNITQYFFEWTHDNIMEEPYINHTMLQEYLKKYNWSIKSKYVSEENVSEGNIPYDWFIIMKNN